MADVVHGGSAGSTHLLGDNSAAPVSWVRDSIIPLLSWKMDSSCSYRIRRMMLYQICAPASIPTTKRSVRMVPRISLKCGATP